MLALLVVSRSTQPAPSLGPQSKGDTELFQDGHPQGGEQGLAEIEGQNLWGWSCVCHHVPSETKLLGCLWSTWVIGFRIVTGPPTSGRHMPATHRRLGLHAPFVVSAGGRARSHTAWLQGNGLKEPHQRFTVPQSQSLEQPQLSLQSYVIVQVNSAK